MSQIITQFPRGKELVRRYKKNYGIPKESLVTEQMILAHWELEQKLTKKLLASTPSDRWKTFERCYSILYAELDWLNQLSHVDKPEPLPLRFASWTALVGAPPKSIYEIGSGKGEMITYLATHGHCCKASEITRERGEKHVEKHENLSWGVTDGVHLEKFEKRDHFDVVLSNQVIEHFHPDDLFDHLKGVHAILREKGCYIFSTPHCHGGPCDVSRVFNCERPMGMHLKEYTYTELKDLLKKAGFSNCSAVLRLPKKLCRVLGLTPTASSSGNYLSYLCFLEKCIALLPRQAARRTASRFAQGILFSSNIFMVGHR